jgi:hypothetical protein
VSALGISRFFRGEQVFEFDFYRFCPPSQKHPLFRIATLKPSGPPSNGRADWRDGQRSRALEPSTGVKSWHGYISGTGRRRMVSHDRHGLAPGQTPDRWVDRDFELRQFGKRGVTYRPPRWTRARYSRNSCSKCSLAQRSRGIPQLVELGNPTARSTSQQRADKTDKKNSGDNRNREQHKSYLPLFSFPFFCPNLLDGVDLARAMRANRRIGRDSIDHPRGSKNDVANAIAGVAQLLQSENSVTAGVGDCDPRGDLALPAWRARIRNDRGDSVHLGCIECMAHARAASIS